ncbi:Uncharacterised protein [Streptococcus pneumoniae]|nr:Uncharacterised protein [Streptococcus pneumoniae]
MRVAVAVELRAEQGLSTDRPVGREHAERVLVVQRGHHVQVGVEDDVLTLRGGQGVHVVVRAQQADLLGAPQGEADLALGLVGLGGLARDLEGRRDARGVVVDARALRHAVQVGAEHHDVVVAARARLRQHVPGGPLLHELLEVQGDGGAAGAGLGQQIGAQLAGHAHGPDDVARRGAQGAVQRALGVVVDDDGLGTGGGRDLGLLGEGAVAPGDQGDAAGQVRVGPVRVGAAGGGAGGGGERGVGDLR